MRLRSASARTMASRSWAPCPAPSSINVSAMSTPMSCSGPCEMTRDKLGRRSYDGQPIVRERAMRRIIGLCAGLALMAFPALADAPFAPPTPLLDAAPAKPSAKVVAHGFTLNGVHGVLTKTTFAEVQKRFGGQMAR